MIEVTGKNNVYAKVIAHSISETGNELMTLEIQCHRFIWSELMTHRTKSRNAESTRAIPLQTSINTMYSVPAIPIKFTAKSKGMQSHVECNEPITYKGKQYTPTDAWLRHMDDTAELVRAYDRGGYHKQHVGRLLEPFKMIKAVVSATEWDNFLILRYESETDYSAQIEIHELADCMLKAKNQSVPVLLKRGEWHTPYYTDGYWKPNYDIEYTTTTFGELVDVHGITLKDALKISSSCCAQVSYRKLDDTLEKALDVYDKLVMSQPRHYSAVEHCGTPCKAHSLSSQSFDPANWDNGVTHVDARGDWWSGNFKEWVQYRQVLMFDLNEKYTTYDDWVTSKENLA